VGGFSVATGFSVRRKASGRTLDTARYASKHTLLFAGEAVVELDRTETANYRDNLASGAPALWIALRPAASEQPYEILSVTADPTEGEAFTDAGSNLVEAVPMPPDIVEVLAKFVAQHHVERPFVKRQRDQKAPSDRRVGREKEE
jgi:hypothetical protein